MDCEDAEKAVKALRADFTAMWSKAVAKITDDPDVLLVFYAYPDEG